MIETSVIIVKYKADKWLEKCLASIPKSKKIEVITVDNDLSNRGFAKGVNEGVKKARGKYLLLLNPDCRLYPNTIIELVGFLKTKPKAAVVGPQLVDENKKAYLSVTKQPTKLSAIIVYSVINKWWPQNRISRDYWYKDKDLTQPSSVESISGAIMCFRREDFIEIGGLDEAFFMYWEDYDICARLIKLGREVWFYPKAVAVHAKEGSTARHSFRIKQIFWSSRLKFFRKHFGYVYGTLAAAGLWLQEEWQFSLMMIAATFLRFYRLPELMPFLGDQGRDFLAAAEAVKLHQLPWLGIESSVPRFAQGPVYVWGLMGLQALGLKDPIWAGYMAALTGILALILAYLLVYKFFSKQIALITVLLVGFSPLAIAQARLAFMTNPIPLVSLFYLFSLLRPYQNWKNWFWVGFSFALLFQFELAILPLAGLIVWYGWKYRKVMGNWRRRVGILAIALITGLLPQIIYDLTHQFRQLTLFGIWAVYRIAAFVGFDREHAVSVSKISGYSQHLWTYLHRFFSWGLEAASILYIVVIVIGLWLALRKYLKHNLSKRVEVIWWWLVLLSIGFMVHSSPSEAYFPVLFFPLAIFFGWTICQFPVELNRVIIAGLAAGAVLNGWYVLDHDFLMTTVKNTRAGLTYPYGTPLATQKKLVAGLINVYGVEAELKNATEAGGVPHFLDGYVYLQSLVAPASSVSGRTVYLYYDADNQPRLKD